MPMQRFITVVRPQRAEALCRALLEAGLATELEVVEVMGSNRGVEKLIAAPFAIEAVPMAKVSGVIDTADREAFIELALIRSRTGRIGDGKIFLLPVTEVQL